jgi:3',5'-cyclic AMP phosphodiesterase CpdA
MAEALSILQVSDSHLSETHAWFWLNWPVFLGEVGRRAPTFVLHTGDVSFNGPDRPADLTFARRCLDAIEAPWGAIAGNHDVGEAPVACRLDQPVNDARLSAWRAAFGPSWWVRDLDKGDARLRIIALDTALMGSEHADEAEQDAFLADALAARDGRPVLLALHMPPFGDDPEDTRITTHCVPPEPRKRLLQHCLQGGVAAIAAGHIHRYSVADWHGIAVVTAPPTAFVNLPKPPVLSPRRRAGYLEWTVADGALTHRLIEPPHFLTLDASSWTDATATSTNLPERPLSSLAALAPFA